ncbi:hypothetical protein Ciccas_007976 [Cichlidogyrus casuarinus]|uniref:Uncharacterized protein n=1 Tax=Cichlidogyrus casuarinus TaxID=1844966 RepID=A0ABD2Q233_9PLAT
MKQKLPYKINKDARRQNLLEDNELEDRNIKKLEKKLGLKARAKRKKTVSHPLWLKEMGLESSFLIIYS